MAKGEMMMKKGFEESIVRAVEFMAISAITAPKAKGEDYVDVKVLTGTEVNELADAMLEYGKTYQKKNYDRDGEKVRNSTAVLLLSLKDSAPAGLNCGACGKNKCAELTTIEGTEFEGPLCAWRLLDLGIAIGSAAKTAGMFNLDNRIMYRIGAVVKKTGMMSGQIIVGIPVSVTSKNIYFDR